MRRIITAFLLCFSFQLSAGEMQAVELYSQDDLLELIRNNQHLQRIQADDCQLVQDIEARANVMQLPSYQLLLADMLLFGICLDKDIQQGFTYLEKAAEQGLPDALEQLGRYYLQGRFVITDAKYGYRLLHKAALFGHPKATLTLASHYAAGNGSPLDYPEIYMLLNEAVYESPAQRHEAEQLMNQLALHLPQSVLNETRRRAVVQ